MHIRWHAPGEGHRITVWIHSLRVQSIGFSCLQRHCLHCVHDWRLVSFWRFIHNLHINGVAQAFSIRNRQAEHHGLIAGRCRNVEGGFRFGAVGESYRWARNLGPFVGNRIAVWIAGSRTIKRDGCRARDVLIRRRRDWRMVGDDRIDRGRTAQQTFVHRVQDVAGIRVNRPGKESAQVFRQHILAFSGGRACIFIGDQVAGRLIEDIWRFSIRVVTIFPARLAFVLVNDLTVVDHARFPGTFHHTGCGTREWIVTGVAMHASPAAAIHARTHHDLAWLYALSKQRVHAVLGGVVRVRTP